MNASDVRQPRYWLEDLRSPFMEIVLTSFMYLTSTFALFLTLLLTFVVLTKTPQNMSSYKNYLLIHMGAIVCVEIGATAAMPVALLGDFGGMRFVAFSIGWGAAIPSSWMFGVILCAVWSVCELYCLICALALERYFAVVFLRKPRSMLLPLVAVTNFVALSLYLAAIIPAISDGILADFPNTLALVRETIVDSDELFAQHPNTFLVDINNVRNSSIVFFAVLIVIGHCFSVFPLLFTFLKARKQAQFFARASSRVHHMLMLTCIAQLLGTVIFLAGPVGVLWVFIVWAGVRLRVLELCIMAGNTYILYDIVILFITMRPYRDFLWRFVTRAVKKDTATHVTSTVGTKHSPVVNQVQPVVRIL